MNPTAPLLPPFRFDEIPVDPEAMRKEKLGNAKQEIGEILKRLSKCCLLGGDNIQWPKASDLRRLDELVLKTWMWMRKLPKKRSSRFTPPWSRYRAVDRYWTGLRLCNGIERLLKRARENTPQRPFALLWQISAGRNLGIEFFGTTHPMTLKEPATVASVDWEAFEPLFLGFKNEESKVAGKSRRSVLETRLGDVPGSARLVAYAVYLEIKTDDQAWVRKHWAGAYALTNWVSMDLQNLRLMRMLKRFEVGDDSISRMESWERETRQSAKREVDKERKRRERARKGKNSLPKA